LALRATAEQLKSAIHLVDDDLGGVAFHSVFFPLAGAESAFDVALAPFSQILTRDFGDLAEEHYAVPLGTLLLLAGLLLFPAFAGGQGYVRYGVAVRGLADCRVAAGVADENHFVDASCHGVAPIG